MLQKISETRKRKKKRKIIESRYCLDCGKQLNKYGDSLRCYSCQNKIMINNRDQKGKNNPNWKDGICKIKKYYCKECSKSIGYQSGSRGSGLCRACSQIGKRNARYIHGQGNTPYPLEFSKGLKEKIRKRDNYICQVCGIIEEEHIIVFGEVLSIHHIDYDKQNCKENNLTTLCRGCNTRVNFNRNHWIEYFKGRV